MMKFEILQENKTVCIIEPPKDFYPIEENERGTSTFY